MLNACVQLFFENPGMHHSMQSGLLIATDQGPFDAPTIRARMLARLARFFAMVASLLSGVGLYGVLFDSVIQRHPEIRYSHRASSACPQRVRPIVSAISVALEIGTAEGLILGLMSTHSIELLLYQVMASDPIQLAAPCLVILLVAMRSSKAAIIPIAWADIFESLHIKAR